MFKNGVPGIPLSKDWSTHKKLAFFKMMVDAGVLPWATFTGNPIQFDAPKAHTLKSVKVEFSPKQDLHGQDAPWPAGGGKNKFKDTFDGWTKPNNYWTYPVALAEGNWIVSTTLRTGKTKVTGCAIGFATSGTDYASFQNLRLCVGTDGSVLNPTYATVASTDSPCLVFYGTAESFAQIIDAYEIQLEAGTVSTPYSPYSNICPISGWTGVDIYNEPDYDPTAQPMTTLSFGQTVYGGTAEVAEDGTGQGSGNMSEPIDLGTLGWTEYSGIFYANISDKKHDEVAPSLFCTQYKTCSRNATGAADAIPFMADYEITGFNYPSSTKSWLYIKDPRYTTAGEFTTAMSGVMLSYPLATPVPFTVTPSATPTAVKGINTMWTDGDNLTVEARAEEVNNA